MWKCCLLHQFDNVFIIRFKPLIFQRKYAVHTSAQLSHCIYRIKHFVQVEPPNMSAIFPLVLQYSHKVCHVIHSITLTVLMQNKYITFTIRGRVQSERSHTESFVLYLRFSARHLVVWWLELIKTMLDMKVTVWVPRTTIMWIHLRKANNLVSDLQV